MRNLKKIVAPALLTVAMVSSLTLFYCSQSAMHLILEIEAFGVAGALYYMYKKD